MRITVEQSLGTTAIEAFYEVYEQAFGVLRTRTAARHLLTPEEFGAEMRDERISKYVGWDDAGQPAALVTLTTDLAAVPWINAGYYEARFPAAAARGALFYLGYALVRPGSGGSTGAGPGALARIGAKIFRRVHESDGVCGFDVAAYNDELHQVGAKLAALGRRGPMKVEILDVQSYYAAVFDDPAAPSVPPQRSGGSAVPVGASRPAAAATRTAPGATQTAPEAANASPAPATTGAPEQRAPRSPEYRTVPLSERPDLAAGILDVLNSRWPAFMLAGNPGYEANLIQLLAVDAPGHQILLVDSEDTVVGAGLSLPIEWDGTVAGLPSGWDAVVDASAALVASGSAPTAVSALSVTISPQAARHGLAEVIVRALKAAAVAVGAPGLLVPVRPILKPQYPLIPLERYVTWRTAEGDVFDPWLRLHQRLGAEVLAIADDSLLVTGTVAEWEGWTGLALPDSGAYVVPGGLVPLQIDVTADTGTYREPNVWVHHPAG
ncbi:MAG: hypothetical protein QOD41_2470 [Cryptosporangiaceae bacterium]|nr:hypothetical protein [Cryptosporangiaceae bacterium]